jgi:hypothetical protein
MATPDVVSAAWVTFANTPAYVMAACVLHASLQAVGTRYPLVLMVPEEEGAEESVAEAEASVAEAEAAGIRVKRVASLAQGGARHGAARFAQCVNKVHAWALTEYAAVCWMDADMVVMRNMDAAVFEEALRRVPTPEHVAAARGCRCNVFGNPKFPTDPAGCPFANPDADAYYFNAGLMLLRPAREVHARLLRESYDHPMGDQDTFNLFFRGRVARLSSALNFMAHLPRAHPGALEEVGGEGGVCVFHFTYGKPWEEEGERARGGENARFYEAWEGARGGGGARVGGHACAHPRI